MNTRLQVEHPVSEMITGLDLVEQMIRVAAGEKLAFKQKDLKIKGWAIESRIYAEDPYRNFLPSIGRLKNYQAPPEGKTGDVTLRNETGVREGDEISMFYDPMIAKLITHAPTRLAAIDAHRDALERLEIQGIQDNSPFLAAVLGQERFRSGAITTAYIKEEFPNGFSGMPATPEDMRLAAAVAAYVHAVRARRADQTSGRVEPARLPRQDWVVLLGGARLPVRIRLGEGEAEIVHDGEDEASELVTSWRPGQPLFQGELDGEPFAAQLTMRDDGYVIRRLGVELQARVCTPFAAELHARLPEKPKPDMSRLIVSPMPGLVVAVAVTPGQEVKAGEAVCVVEAMKMQNIIRAEADGVVKAVNASAGASVAADEVLVEFN
jgi:propionyl-CoA carboxylase alpha chain